MSKKKAALPTQFKTNEEYKEVLATEVPKATKPPRAVRVASEVEVTGALPQPEVSNYELLNPKGGPTPKERANAIIEQSRKMGNELAGQIEQRAKKNAEEIIISAKQEIEGERERVRNALKKESAQTAVSLAEKILKENLDTEKTRNLINQAIKDI